MGLVSGYRCASLVVGLLSPISMDLAIMVRYIGLFFNLAQIKQEIMKKYCLKPIKRKLRYQDLK